MTRMTKIQTCQQVHVTLCDTVPADVHFGVVVETHYFVMSVIGAGTANPWYYSKYGRFIVRFVVEALRTPRVPQQTYYGEYCYTFSDFCVPFPGTEEASCTSQTISPCPFASMVAVLLYDAYVLFEPLITAHRKSFTQITNYSPSWW